MIAAEDTAYRHFTVAPIAGALGAAVSGTDLRHVDDAAFADILQAFHHHLVLFFPDQDLSRDELKAFTRRFGPLLRVPFVEPLADDPDIIAVLKEAAEQDIAIFGGAWHSDFSCLRRPPLGSVLYALDVPPFGGDTLWSNMYLAYDALSEGMKRLLAPLRAVHTGRPYGTKAALKVPNPSRSIKMARGDPAADMDTAHPIVRRHPETGRPALFVNPIYTSHIEGMTAEESAPLLEMLYRLMTRPELTCRHRWRAGDVALWDNRATLHLALNDYDGHRRLLYRTTIAGERPLGAN